MEETPFGKFPCYLATFCRKQTLGWKCFLALIVFARRGMREDFHSEAQRRSSVALWPRDGFYVVIFFFSCGVSFLIMSTAKKCFVRVEVGLSPCLPLHP